MRTSKYLLASLRETPAEAEIVSHQLMLRAGMIRKIAAGIYNWLPMGLRVLRKVEAVIRDEMDSSGALEVLMPSVQPAELWRESERWGQYGPELLRLQDRHQREFCFGPTHEEIITDLVRREIKSYKQLPIIFYQIQTKFRDEIRPRFGIMRAREFLMKDAYSFHLSDASLQETYELMLASYRRIFDRLGLQFRVVQADGGNIGGDISHEFHVLADSGEDQIAFSSQGDYAANVELAPAPIPAGARPQPAQQLQTVATPGQHSIEDISRFLNISPEKCIKTLIVKDRHGGLAALALRGDHELSHLKAEKHPLLAAPLEFADAENITTTLNCPPGSIGPVDLGIPLIVDHSALHVSDFVCGANQADKHLTGVNWGRDIPEPRGADIRNVVDGDPAPDGSGNLKINRGIEVGHIFQLGKKYSSLMHAGCLDKDGQAQTLIMGCYGLGISRIVAAAIEQNHDQYGIVWPDVIAPFQIILIPINMHKSQRLRQAVTELYRELRDARFEILLDDRKERPGVMFSDAELIGIPHRLTFSERGLDAGAIEYQHRNMREKSTIALPEVRQYMSKLIKPAISALD